MRNYSLGVIAVVPFWSQSRNLNLDSNYVYIKIVIEEFLKILDASLPRTLFLVLFPNPKYGGGGWRYTPDGFFSSDKRIKGFYWNYDTQMRSGVMGFDPLKYKQIDSHFSPSIIWLNQVESGVQFQGEYIQSFSAINNPILIAQHHYIIHKSLPYVEEGLFPRKWLQLGGSLASDRVIYNSLHTQKMAHESFGELLNTATMATLKKKEIVHRFGLVRKDDPVSPPANKNTIPVILYNHRFLNYKNPRDTFNVLKTLRKKYKFKVWITQASANVASGKDFVFFDEALHLPKRDDYLHKIAIPAINTINSSHETFCISVLDSIAAGHLVVLPNAVTFPELVPDGYPFLFNNLNEQQNMLDYLLGNFTTEFNKWSPILSAHARQTFLVKRYAEKYLDIFQEGERLVVPAKIKSSKHYDKLQNFFRSLHGDFRVNTLHRRIIGKLQIGGAQSYTHRRVIREALYFREDASLFFVNDGVVVRFP